MADINSFLIIDDDADFRALLSTRLRKLFTDAKIDEHDPVVEGDFPPESMCAQYEVIFLDHDLKGKDTGLTWFKSCHKREGFPATIMITSLGNPTTAIHALNSGVHFYMTKQSLDEESLINALETAVKSFQDRSIIATNCT